MPKKTTKAVIDFEKSLAELTTIVEKMEAGDLSLNDSLKSFERGIQLTRSCQQTLKDAEQKIQILTKDQDEEELYDFGNDDEL